MSKEKERTNIRTEFGTERRERFVQSRERFVQRDNKYRYTKEKTSDIAVSCMRGINWLILSKQLLCQLFYMLFDKNMKKKFIYIFSNSFIMAVSSNNYIN